MSKSMRKRLQAQGVMEDEIDRVIEVIRAAIMADILGAVVVPEGAEKRNLAVVIDVVIKAMGKEAENADL